MRITVACAVFTYEDCMIRNNTIVIQGHFSVILQLNLWHQPRDGYGINQYVVNSILVEIGFAFIIYTRLKAFPVFFL